MFQALKNISYTIKKQPHSCINNVFNVRLYLLKPSISINLLFVAFLYLFQNITYNNTVFRFCVGYILSELKFNNSF